MQDGIREFVIDALREMNYDVDDVDDDTTLGPAGVDLESLALAELAVRVEDRYGVKFDDDESEQLAAMTVGEFTGFVAARLEPAPGGPVRGGAVQAGAVQVEPVQVGAVQVVVAGAGPAE
jgi:acyl carrier protein